eukprot:SAG31_NODE_389_length_16370_cov_4.517915_17_plen_510_part_00
MNNCEDKKTMHSAAGEKDRSAAAELNRPVVVPTNRTVSLQQSTQYATHQQPGGAPAARAQRSSVTTEVALFLMMGMSGWWTVNAILWAETPIFVADSPEKKRISNLVSVACQFGNLFPFCYKAVLSRKLQKKYLGASIVTCQVIAILAAGLCAFGWEWTVTLHPFKIHTEYTEGGTSVGLIAATVLAGGAGCLSSVTFWVMCSRYPGTHTETAMSVGTTVGGLLLAGVANFAQQRPGEPPRFSARDFMIGVAACQIFFLCTSILTLRRQAQPSDPPPLHISPSGTNVPKTSTRAAELRPSMSRTPSRTGSGFFSTIGGSKNDASDGESPASSPHKGTGSLRAPLLSSVAEATEQNLHPCLRKVILFMMFSVYGMTYTMPSFAPYVVGAYPNHAILYSRINMLTQAGDVLGRASTAIPWVPNFAILGLMWFVVMGISGGIIAATAFSHLCPTILPGKLAYVFPVRPQHAGGRRRRRRPPLPRPAATCVVLLILLRGHLERSCAERTNLAS